MTVEKVNAANLKSGDGVFFERGGLWRNVPILTRNGVTYSAYGTGEKPRFYGGPEDGANPKYWSLVRGTANVWQYHIDLGECALISFNGDEKIAEKYIAYWDHKAQRYAVSLDLKTPFTVGLLKNNEFFSDVNLKGIKGFDTTAREGVYAEGTHHGETNLSFSIWGSDYRGNYTSDATRVTPARFMIPSSSAYPRSAGKRKKVTDKW